MSETGAGSETRGTDGGEEGAREVPARRGEYPAEGVEPVGGLLRLLAVFTLPGAAIGFALWAVLETGVDGRFGEPAMAGSLVALVAGALGWGLGNGAGRRRTAFAFALALAALGGGMAFSAALTDAPGAAWGVFATAVLVAVALPFFRVRERGERGSALYPALFAEAWTLPMIAGLAFLFAQVGYALAWLLVGTFSLIGLDGLGDGLAPGEPAFLVLQGALFASGIGIVREGERVVLALRAVLFALARALAPAFAFGTVVFALALLVRGFDALDADWSPAVLLLSCLAAALAFVNASVGDRPDARGAVVLVARVQSLAMPVLAGLAAWAVAIRLIEHGPTPERLLAALLVAFACAYAALYALAALFARWTWLHRGNVALAAALALALGLSTLPPFALERVSAEAQVERLRGGDVPPERFDFHTLAFGLGAPGRAAFEAVRADAGSADPARVLVEIARAEAAGPRGSPSDRPRVPIERVPAGDVLAGDVLDESLRARVLDYCSGERVRTILLLSDRASGRAVAVCASWHDAGGDEGHASARIGGFRHDGEAWASTWIAQRFGPREKIERFVAAARTSGLRFASRALELPVVGGETLVPDGMDDPFFAPAHASD